MDLGAILTWLGGLGLTASESLLAGAVICLACALAVYARHVDKHTRNESRASTSYMQALIDKLMAENRAHTAASPAIARSLESLDERIERIERALMERKR